MPTWITKLPFLGDALKWVADRVWPDSTAKELKELEIELEHARKGRISPRMAYKYLAIFALCLMIVSSMLNYFFPDTFGALPDIIGHVLSVGAVFGM